MVSSISETSRLTNASNEASCLVPGIGDSSGGKAPHSPDPRWPYLNRWTEPKVLSSPQPLATSPTISPLKSRLPPSSRPPLTSPTVALVNSLLGSDLQIADSVCETEVVCAASKFVLQGKSSELIPDICNKVVVDKDIDSNHGGTQAPSLKGAWTKKLNFASSSHQCPSKSRVDPKLWPSLAVSSTSTQINYKLGAMEDDVRFPWAAKMNPASRNLYRATEPEYLQDGTPKVTIPQHVLLRGLENQKEYILGQFYRCSPPSGGLIFAVFNKLWGRNCKITIRKLGESNYLFHIPDTSTRTWVLQRGLWHVDDCLMFVAPWAPEASLAIPEIKTIPVWVTLKKIPNILYSIPGISHIASGLGAPMATYKPKLDPILMGEAKILVEVELSKAFPSRVAADDENGFISMVDVEYAWLPSKCERCGQLGHKVKRCLQATGESHIVATEVAEIVSNDNILATSTAPNTLLRSAQPKATSTSSPEIEVFPPNILLDASNESNSIVSNIIATTDDLISLATISVLENMASQSAPTVICINESIESPILESAQILTVTDTSIAQASSMVEKESKSTPDFGSNKFGSLISLEEEDYSSDSDKDLDSMDLMTPSGKRILRERPVKPSTKAKEMYLLSTGRGRGNRGRGNRGGTWLSTNFSKLKVNRSGRFDCF